MERAREGIQIQNGVGGAGVFIARLSDRTRVDDVPISLLHPKHAQFVRHDARDVGMSDAHDIRTHRFKRLPTFHRRIQIMPFLGVDGGGVNEKNRGTWDVGRGI